MLYKCFECCVLESDESDGLETVYVENENFQRDFVKIRMGN